MKNYNKILLVLGLIFSSLGFSQNQNCADMEPICTDAGLSFTANSGLGGSGPGNNYGCLFTQPNPAWYYLEIATSGNIIMSLSAPSDIDFIIWGPFTDLAAAQGACGAQGVAPNPPIVDCSYSATASETPEIIGAVAGQVYVLLITNYASVVQPVTLVQTGGTGATDCSIVSPDPCVSHPGTFVNKKNGIITSQGTPANPIYLCQGQNYSIESNNDYILPNDTIPAPVGDGIYSAQLMYLVYNAPPVSGDPSADPGFLNFIIPSEDIFDINNSTSPIITNFGCGTYYFVPVAGDDGVGGNGNVANGINDNGGLDWDKNNNGCYVLGNPIAVTYACQMTITPSINCSTLNNGVNFVITGGSGNYTVSNLGAGNIVSTSVPNGGTAQVYGLSNFNSYQISVTDNAGCTATSTSTIFNAPTYNSVNIIPALSCPDASLGTVNVAANGASGNGGVVEIIMNGISETTTLPNDSYSNIAGTLVEIQLVDNLGCTTDSSVTITSSGHFINVQIVSQTGESCFGDGLGSATITAQGVNSAGVPDGSIITSIVWQHESGTTIPGGATNTSQTGMAVGVWVITVTDNTGCVVSISLTIDGPPLLDLVLNVKNDATCFGGNDGSATVSGIGGAGGYTYAWTPANPSAANPTYNNMTAGNYTCVVTDANGCTDNIVVTINHPAQITAHFTLKEVLCYGDATGAIIIDSVTNNAGNVYYIWNLITVPNPPVTSNIASGLPAGTYQFKIKDDNDCERQYTVTIHQNDSLYWTELGVLKPAVCRNEIPFDNGQGQIFAAAGRGGTGVGGTNFTYLWTENSTGATTTNSTWGNKNPGFYTIIATDEWGCTLTETIYLDSLSPIAAFDVTSPHFTSPYTGTAVVDVTITNLSQNYAFSTDPNADTTFIWTFGFEGETPYITSDINEIIQKSYLSEGVYEICLVVIENLNGCKDTACQSIQIFDPPILIIPNIFSPDGDGINDFFFFPNQAIVEFKAVVYDRWGKEIFVFESINDQWDGKNNSNGKDCVDGVYFYTYEAVSSNGTEFEGQGNVHIVRSKN